MKLAGLVFDFDGVLADSLPAHERAWTLAARRLEFDGTVIDGLRANLYRGCGGHGMFDDLALDREQRRRLRACKDELWNGMIAGVPFAPGAAQRVRELHAYLPLAIASSSPASTVHALLDRDDLRPCFRMVVTREDVVRLKPAPDALDLICTALGLKPREVLVVGDTEADAGMSAAAGANFVRMQLASGPMVENWPAAPAVTVTDWNELAAYVQSLRSAPAAP